MIQRTTTLGSIVLGTVSLALSGSLGLELIAQQPAAPAPDPPAVAPLETLRVPEGFTITVFASGLPGARLMAVSPEGTLVVARRTEVVALPDRDGNGQAEPVVVATSLTNVYSVAFRGEHMYVGTMPAVLRFPWRDGQVSGPAEQVAALPDSKPAVHVSRSVRFGPDGRLYVAVGSSCNVCVEADARRTTIQVFEADGTKGRTFAGGLRNAVGFDWDPRTGRLWAGDTGQEGLGDDTPPDEINLVEDGRHYGFPFFHGRNVPSDVPELKDAPRTLTADGVQSPALELPAHATPLGVSFYTGSAFPAQYADALYVALHGSTTRSTKVGYKVLRVAMRDGKPHAADDFVTGWLQGDVVSGRPSGIVIGRDGALYISDDNKGFIYRVAYKG